MTTRHGLLLITLSSGICVKQLAVNSSESEYWLTGKEDVLEIRVARNKQEIRSMLNSLKSKKPQLDIEKISNLNRWVVFITCIPYCEGKDHIQNTTNKAGTNVVQPNGSGSDARMLPKHRLLGAKRRRWTDLESDTSIDFSEKPLPQLALTSKSVFGATDRPQVSKGALAGLTARKSQDSRVRASPNHANLSGQPTEHKPGPKHHQTMENECNLTNHPWIRRCNIAGQNFWLSKKRGSGLQQFVFNRADKLDHRVCVVLEHFGRRLYTSFSKTADFWKYYSEFKGKICLY